MLVLFATLAWSPVPIEEKHSCVAQWQECFTPSGTEATCCEEWACKVPNEYRADKFCQPAGAERDDCGSADITPEECKAKGCYVSYPPQGSKLPWCVKPIADEGAMCSSEIGCAAGFACQTCSKYVTAGGSDKGTYIEYPCCERA